MILKVLSGILWMLFLGTVIYGSMFWLLCLTDWEKTVHVKKGKRRVLGGIAVGNAIAVILICRMEEQMGIGAVGKQAFRMGATEILLSLLAGGLLAAACMDAENCYVYNYVWWWCLLWTGILCGVSAAGQNTAGECDPEGKAAYTGAVYSLYCDNLLGGNRGNVLSAGRINAYLTHIYA